MLYGERELLRSSILKGILYLAHMQNYDGSIGHNRSLWNIWETILACRVLVLSQQIINTDASLTPVINQALDFLKSCENSQGLLFHEILDSPELNVSLTAQERFKVAHLFCLNKEAIDFNLNVKSEHTKRVLDQYGLFCMETSAEYLKLMALFKSDNLRYGTVEKPLSFIASLQEPCGAWSSYSLVPDFVQRYPSVTGIVMQAFLAHQTEPEDKEAALHFLCQTQKTSGHWGADPYFLGTPYYAMNPVLSVLACANQHNKYSQILKHAQQTLLSLQNEDGSWYYQLKEWSIYNTLSPELQTGLALKCCFHLNLSLTDMPVQKSTAFLLSRQLYDGSWYGGFYPTPPLFKLHKPEPIYATTHILQALLSLYAVDNKALLSLIA